MINYISKNKKKYDCTKKRVEIKKSFLNKNPIVKDVDNNISVNIFVKAKHFF